jgi:hypothetical protein
MFEKSLSFLEVKNILQKLGFRHGTASAKDAKTPVDQIVFIHDKTDTLFVFPANTVDVGPARLESVRRILVGRGVVDEDVINQMLDSRSRKTVA